MSRIRPLSPDGQVMISDMCAHLLGMGLPGRQSAGRQGWGQQGTHEGDVEEVGSLVRRQQVIVHRQLRQVRNLYPTRKRQNLVKHEQFQ
jgi:hypothetical protein